MEGQDVSDAEAYDAQTLKLAQGEISQKDRDGDNKVSLSEYIFDEFCTGDDSVVQEYREYLRTGVLTPGEALNELSGILSTTIGLFEIMDNKMGSVSNSDNLLDENELQQYTKLLDAYSVDSDDRTPDGKINLDSLTEYPEYLTGQLTTSKAIIDELALKLANKLLFK